MRKSPFLLLISLLVACVPIVTPSPEMTLTPSTLPDTATPEWTPTTTPSPTLAPTTTPMPTTTPTVTPTPTPIPVIALVELPFVNPSFEGDYHSRTIDGRVYTTMQVADGWEPFACDEPFVAGGCPASPLCPPGQTVGCNPPNTRMGLPEWKPALGAYYPNRVVSGERAQQFFLYSRAGLGGICQNVVVPPGYDQCHVGAHVQSWSQNRAAVFTSQLETDDDRRNSTWRIHVDLAGGGNPLAPGVQVSRAFGYDDDIYDRWSEIQFTFEVGRAGGPVTVCFMDRRLWPLTHNDSYIDDVWGYCEAAIGPTPTPSPTPTATTTPTPEPTPTRFPVYYDDEGHDVIAWCQVLASPCLVARVAPGMEWDRSPVEATGVANSCYPYGATLAVYDLARDSQGAYWLSPTWDGPTWVMASWCRVHAGPNGEWGWFSW